MEFDPTQAMKQLKTIQRELNRIDQKVGRSIRQRNKDMRDHIRHQKHISQQYRRTQRVLEKAKRAASQGTRKKGRTVGSVQGRETPPKVLYKMSDKLSRDLISSKTELDKAHIDLKDAVKKITALSKVGRTEQHSRNINTLQKKVAKAAEKISQLVEKLNSPLADVQEQNQSYDSSPPRIIEDYDMVSQDKVSPGQLKGEDVSPGQLKGEELNRVFSASFPGVSDEELLREFEIEQQLAAEQARAKLLAAEQDKITEALTRSMGLTAQDEKDIERELQELELMEGFQGGKRKKRKTRKRKRRRKTRKRKKKRHKRKTRRR
jgi:hypothetical protein